MIFESGTRAALVNGIGESFPRFPWLDKKITLMAQGNYVFTRKVSDAKNWKPIGRIKTQKHIKILAGSGFTVADFELLLSWLIERK